MAAPDPQGSSITFAGYSLGRVTGFAFEKAAGSSLDVTPVSAVLVGSGAGVRVKRQVVSTMIEPATVQISFLGMPSGLTDNSIGMVGTLVITSPVVNVNAYAYLAAYSAENATGEKVRGSATFQLTGA
jgi:hypothetical protein